MLVRCVWINKRERKTTNKVETEFEQAIVFRLSSQRPPHRRMNRTPFRTLGQALRTAQQQSRPSSTLSSFASVLSSSSSSPPLASTSSHSQPSINHATLSATSPFTAPPKPRDPAAVEPDAELLSVLARLIMRDGKLARTHSHLAQMLNSLQLATNSPPLPILKKALELASPSIRIVGRRQGTKVLQTPQPLTAAQRRRQSWKWIVEASDKRQGVEKDFGKRLSLEVLAVLNGQSEATKKKELRHTQGVTGRAKWVYYPSISRLRIDTYASFCFRSVGR